MWRERPRSCGGQDWPATRCCRTSEDARATLSVIIDGRGNQPRGKRFDSIRSVKVDLCCSSWRTRQTPPSTWTHLRPWPKVAPKSSTNEIFASLLVNEKRRTCESVSRWDMRAEVAERVKIKIGEGVTGQAQSVARPSWSMTCRSIPIHLGGARRALGHWRFH